MGGRKPKGNAENLSKQQWRLCPPGEYWRKAHYQSTYQKKDGTVVREHPVQAGCCDNPSKKDQIYSEELKLIAHKFSGLGGPPTADNLEYPDGNKFDSLIRGWTQFWNDILDPKEPLDPNLVKALVATESGFNPDPKRNRKIARGLMQVTELSRKILGGYHGDLKDHLIHVDKKDIVDPVLNIAAGTRWLHEKKRLASSLLGREATWDETVAAYKDYLRKMIKDPNKIPTEMERFRKIYKRLSQ